MIKSVRIVKQKFFRSTPYFIEVDGKKIHSVGAKTKKALIELLKSHGLKETN